jgi:hypothetical protein
MYIHAFSLITNTLYLCDCECICLNLISQCIDSSPDIFDLQHNAEGTDGGCKCKESVCHGGTVNMLFSNFERLPV